MTSYIQATPLAERRAQCQRIAAKHGENMIPVVLQATGKYAKVNFTALPADATVAQLQAAVREVGDVSKRSAYALLVAGCSPSGSTTVADLYANCKAEDGFLYVQYAGEGTMGCIASGGAGGAGAGSGGSGGLDNAFGGVAPSGGSSLLGGS